MSRGPELMRQDPPTRPAMVASVFGLGIDLPALFDGWFGTVVACAVALMVCLGLSMPRIQVTALAQHGAGAGTAGALLGR